MLLSIVYLGEHYVVDALDGFVYVAVAAAIVEMFARWRADAKACYACQTFRMIVRASLSGSWCDGMRTLTTSAAMKRTSGCVLASSALKMTCA